MFLLCGRNGAGKTTLARTLTRSHVELHVIAPSGEWGRWGKPEALAREAVAKRADALVLDDADAYLPATASPFWVRLFATNRHLGMDVLLLSRRPQALPYWAVAAASRAYLLPLGPREREWCARVLRTEPPATGFAPVVVTL